MNAPAPEIPSSDPTIFRPWGKWYDEMVKDLRPSFRYSLEPSDIEECWALARLRSGSMNDADTKNSHNPYPDKPGWWRHYIGVLGEWAYSRFSGLRMDTTTIGRGDDGSDFAGGVQVKASDLEGRKPNLLLYESDWHRKPAKIYVLAWVQLQIPAVSLLGCIRRAAIEQHHVMIPGKFGRTMRVEHTLLHSMDDFPR